MKETIAERRARQRREENEAAQLFEAAKPMRLLHAIAEATQLGFTANMYFRNDNVLHYYFDLDNDVYSDTYAELSSWLLDSIENKLNQIREERSRKTRLEKVKLELLARLTNEEKEALGIQELNVKDYMIRGGEVLIADFDNLQLNGEYWRPIRDEEKIEVMMQMLIDLHSKFERLKDI